MSQTTINKLKAWSSITEKASELFHTLISESDKVVTEKLNEFENLTITLQRDDLIGSDEFKRIYCFIKDMQIMRNKINEKDLMLNAALKKVEELTFNYSEIEKLKNEFLENTSHEIRTPLNSVLGYLELLRNGLYSSQEEMMEFINEGVQSANRLLKLLNDIIDVTHAESGRLEIHLENIDIKKIVRNVYDITKIHSQQKGIAYELNMPDEDIFVRADAERLKQIFVNLISNALKFTYTKGTIKVNIVSLPERGYVLCEVVDNGIGISKENMTIIFDKFTQVEASATRNYQGAGLGLSITKSLIENMGGLILVQSKGKGKGSQFSFTIPLASSQKEYDLNESFNKSNLEITGDKENPLIAVINNDMSLTNSIKNSLLLNGYSVVTGTTADEGFVILKEMNPALIILGWALPRRKNYDLTNGVELYQLIKSNISFSRIPVIITTGHSLDYIKLFNPKISPRKSNYFKKPFNINTLIKRVDYYFKAGAQIKDIIIIMESDLNVFEQISKNIPTTQYTIKNFDNYQNVLPFMTRNHYKKAIFIFNPISVHIVEHDLIDFVNSEPNSIDFSAIVISGQNKYTITKNLAHITKGKTVAITKTALLKNPKKILDLIKKVK